MNKKNKILIILLCFMIIGNGCKIDEWTLLGALDDVIVTNDDTSNEVRKDYLGNIITDPDVLLSRTEYSTPIIENEFRMPDDDEFSSFQELKYNSVLKMGSYEQDNNIENGKEPLEWIVLKIWSDEGYALLISKYAIDYMEFYGENAKNWHDSMIRNWLNTSFYNETFSSTEKEIISDTIVFSFDYDSKYYNSGRGHETNDKIFILSVDEMGYNFGFGGANYSDKKRICNPTEYALSFVGKYDYVPTENVEYWLRTKCDDEHIFDRHKVNYSVCKASFVKSDGSIDTSGGYNKKFIRPAMYIRIK